MFPDLTSPALFLLLSAGGSYLLGSIPFGVVVARVMGLGNLRNIGSGNIGATNVLRTGNKMAALLTLVMDAGKGTVAVLIASRYGGLDMAELAALFVFLGHVFPVWLGFRGGKGVATFLGALFALGFVAGLGVAATWLLVAFLFRMSSAAALLAALASPLWLWVLGPKAAVALAVVLAGLIWIRHAENIRRILAGTEAKIGGGDRQQ